MTAIPLARFLVEFGIDGDRHEDGTRSEAASKVKLAESHTRGYAEGRAAAETEFAARLDAQQQDFVQRLAAARREWSEAEGAVLSDALVGAVNELEARLAETTARILQPFLEAEIRRAAIAELVTAVEAILVRDKAARIEITGPDDLLAIVRDRLPDSVPATFASGQAADIRVIIDQTVLETRLGAWVSAIREAVR